MTSATSNMPDPKRWWVLIGVSLAGILVALDYTVVNICLPTIQHYFGTSTNTLQWLMLGFGLTFSACLAGAGKLADIIGRRKVLYTSVVIFLLASLGAGLAPNMLFLIMMRVLQGICAAAIFPCGTAIIANTFPPQEHARVIGIFGSILGTGLAIGPVIGGLIVSHMNWHWIFFINIPISIIALFICIVPGKLKESKHPETPPIDWVGMFSLITLIAGICFILSQTSVLGLTSPLIISAIFLSFGAGSVFIINTKKCQYPLIPPSLLVNRYFVLGSAVFICTISISWAVAFFTPLYLRQIPGFSINTAALWFAIMTFMTVIIPTIAGYIFDQYSKKIITHLSLITSLIGLIMLAMFSVNTPHWLMIAAFIVFGFAWGAGNGISMPIGLMSAKSHEDAGVISGALLTIANTVGTLFVAIATAIFTLGETSQLLKTLSINKISLNTVQLDQVKAYLSDSEKTTQLITTFGHKNAAVIIDHFQASFMYGFMWIFVVFAIAVTIIYLLCFKQLRRLN